MIEERGNYEARQADVAVLDFGGFICGELTEWLLANMRGMARFKRFHQRGYDCSRNSALEWFRDGHEKILVMLNHDVVPTVPLSSMLDIGDYDLVTARISGPTGEKHPDGNVTACMVIRDNVVQELETPYVPVPTRNDEGTEWDDCECNLFFDKCEKAGLRIGRFEWGVRHWHLNCFHVPS